MTILQKIAAYKRQEVEAAKALVSFDELSPKALNTARPRGFRDALWLRKQAGVFGLIGEIKKASPSRGIIREDFDPPALARAYAEGGAACLSVLTDTPSFQGDIAYLHTVRAVAKLPLLRKDFMLDPYQVAEARMYGADCILIILAMMDDRLANDLLDAAKVFMLDALVEVHDENELARALSLGATMIGINNRDLKTFRTDLTTTVRLARGIPSDILVVAESGLSTRSDLQLLDDIGVTTFLIGESLMRHEDVAAATRVLLGTT